MKITEDQQVILNKAIELLKTYDKEDVSRYTYYFVVSEDDHTEISLEYDCCDNSECIEKTLKELKEEYPECEFLCELNHGDHERIERCYQCDKPLHESLAWIESELDHHEQYSITKDQLQESCIAFEVRVMFEAMPTCDFEISEYAKLNYKRLAEALKDQSNFVERVVKYADKVIKVLE